MSSVDPIIVKIQAEFGQFKADMAQVKSEIGAVNKATQTSSTSMGSALLGANIKAQLILSTLSRVTSGFMDLHKEALKNKHTMDAFSASKLVIADKSVQELDKSFTDLANTIAVQSSGALKTFADELNFIASYWAKAFGAGSADGVSKINAELDKLNKYLKTAEETNARIAKGKGGFFERGFGEQNLENIRSQKKELEGQLKLMDDLKKEKEFLQYQAKQPKGAGLEVGAVPNPFDPSNDVLGPRMESFQGDMQADFTVANRPAFESTGKDPLSNNISSYQDFLYEQETAKTELLNEMFEEALAVGEEQKQMRLDQEVAEYEASAALAMEYAEAELNMRQQINDELNGIDREAARKNQMIWEAGWKGKMSIMGDILGDMGVLMQSENRKMFEIGKASAIASTIIDTYAGAQKAFSSLAGIPIVGPALGGAAAAAAIAGGLMRVQAISSTSMSGGGGINAGASGGGFSGGQSAMQAPQNVVDATFNVQGTSVGKDQIRGMMAGLNELVADGGKLRSVRVI